TERRHSRHAWTTRGSVESLASATTAGSCRDCAGQSARRIAGCSQRLSTVSVQKKTGIEEQMMNDDKQIAVVLDEPMLDVDTDSRSPLRWGLVILLFGFGGFLYWSAFAPLDAGVPADATVHAAGNRKTIQHLE